MTAGQAAEKAAEVLERADMEPNPAMVDSKVRIAEGWIALASALAEIERV
ncbi:hypothetical protein [Allonocardiopsis opalescens]|uniref:Uncharacterized protein n=1 Tax=Allonocardiopsis opalescens TaxID=1144618 RepID=A0A2T0PPK8_9ACTN|nr:hypothetical protein [Allonocardiopsis opalescens]PRX90839.1 hypothetical protein CLV72_11635 [Allonocardiopsis opalescens]